MMKMFPTGIFSVSILLAIGLFLWKSNQGPSPSNSSLLSIAVENPRHKQMPIPEHGVAFTTAQSLPRPPSSPLQDAQGRATGASIQHTLTGEAFNKRTVYGNDGKPASELIRSKLDGSILRKIYVYHPNGDLAREMYLDQTDQKIVECKTYLVGSDAQSSMQIVDCNGKLLQESVVE